MKAKKLWKRILLIGSVMISVVILLYGISVIYLHLADIEILAKKPTTGNGGSWDDLAAAYAKAQYSGYYVENDDYMNEAFADQPWFGYAYYDVYSASMTIYLKEDTEEHRQAVREYIETIDQGGCTYLFDTCSVSYGTFKKDYDRIQNIRYLLYALGMNRADIVRGDLYIELRKGLYAPATALIYLMTEERGALTFYFHTPRQLNGRSG